VLNRFAIQTGYNVNVFDVQAEEMKTQTYTYHRQWSSREDHNRLDKLVRSRQDSFQVLETVRDVLCWSVPGS